jgi:hypothetical protein
MVTKPDQSIEITLQNQLFNEIEAFSLPIAVPTALNSRLTKNLQDTRSTTRLLDLDQLPMTVFADGLPLVSGNLMTASGEEIGDEVSVNLESIGGSFSSKISDLRCCDVPVDDNIIIGEKVGQVRVAGTLRITKSEIVEMPESEYGQGSESTNGSTYKEPVPIETFDKHVEMVLDLPALGFSFPGHCVEDSNGNAVDAQKDKVYSNPNYTMKVPQVQTSYINVTEPFDNSHPYCNARVCYKHYDAESKEGVYETTDKVKICRKPENEGMGPYWVLPADRPQSGICFYVMYFLRRLFKYLDIAYDDSDLYAVEDMRRLCFFTTRCAYGVATMSGKANFFSGNAAAFTKQVNDWADSRGCGGNVEVKMNIQRVESGPTAQYTYTIENEDALYYTADLQQMYATSDNLPEDSVSSVISSLENSFGVRFLFDAECKSCKAVFIRDVFRSTADPLPLRGEVLKMVKLSEKTTGVKVCYSAESDSRDQRDNVRKGVRKYDTDYDYIDYPDTVPGNVIYKRTVVDKSYRDFFSYLSSSDMNCYVDRLTGNAFRIKIDEDAKTAEEWNPVLFEVGGYKGVELGNCAESNKDNMVELVSDFEPVFMNDVNYQAEVDGYESSPLFAAFIDEDMEHEFIEQQVMSVSSFEYGSLSVIAKLRLMESYDPTGTEDGDSPLQHINWGLAVSMMRGGGSDAKVVDYDPNYDGFGNYRWMMVNNGGYQMYGDTMDHFGGRFDYNGNNEGIGSGERFSLKMRAYKPFLYYVDASGNVRTTMDLSLAGKDVKGVSGKTWLVPFDMTAIDSGSRMADRNRGLVDTFMFEYVQFLLKRRMYRVEALCTAAELADIPNHWTDRFVIDGMVGFINKVEYSVSAEDGVGKATIEFFVV